MKLIFLILISASLLLYIFLILATKRGNSSKKVKRYIYLFIGGILLWKFSALLLIADPDYHHSRYYYLLGLVSTGVFLSFFLPLVRSILEEKDQKHRYKYFHLLPILLCILGISFFRNSLALEFGKAGFYIPKVSTVLVFPLLPPLLFFLFAQGILLRALILKKSGLEKNRIIYLLNASVLILIGLLTNLSDLQNYPVDLLFQGLGLVVLTYAGFKYRLVDIKYTYLQTVYSVVQIILAVIIFSGLVTLFSLFFNLTTDWPFSYIPGAVSFVIIYTISSIVSRRSESFSFLAKSRRRFYTDQAFRFSDKALPINTTPEAIKYILNFLKETYGTDKIILCLKDSDKAEFLLYSLDYKNDILKLINSVSPEHPAIRFLEKYKEPFHFEEIEQEIQTTLQGLFGKENFYNSFLYTSCFFGEMLKGFLILSTEERRYVIDDLEINSFSQFCRTAEDIILRAEMLTTLEKQVKEKELLIREVHHRVKNNMQVVMSLLNLSAQRIEDPVTSEALHDCQVRIYTMATVHEYLYRSSSLTEVFMAKYLGNLVKNISLQYHPAPGINLSLECHEVTLDIDRAIYVGMVVTELLCNAYKHAFKERATGKISVSMQESLPGYIELLVSDDGIGYNQELEEEKSSGIGHMVVKGIIESSLKGTWERRDTHGTCNIIRFPFPVGTQQNGN